MLEGNLEDQTSSLDLNKDVIDCHESEIHCNALLPAKLICVPLTVGNFEFSSLLDTGASCSFISETIVRRLNVSIDDTKVNHVMNYGSEIKSTKGCVQLSIKMFGKEFNLKFHVLDDCYIKHKFILGVDFFKLYNVVIDVVSRKLTVKNSDGSLIHVHVTEDNKVDTVQYENFPVFAKEDFSLGNRESKLVPVASNVLDLDTNDYYFDGSHKNDNLYCNCGIMDASHAQIIIENVTGGNK